MKTMSIVFQTEDGETIELSYQDAKEMYNLLHQMFSEKDAPVSPYPYATPMFPNIYGAVVTSRDDSQPFFS